MSGSASGKPYYLTACCIAKDEERDLEEWLEFHRLVGVEHFYVYDNASRDRTTDILDRYSDVGLVTRVSWPGFPGQLSAYEDALRSFGGETAWLAFIDVDEFLFPSSGADLRDTLESYEEFPALAAFWLCFAASGHRRRPEGLLIEHFRCRPADDFPPNGVFKSIVQPDRTTGSAGNAHQFRHVGGEIVDERRRPLGDVSLPVATPAHDVIRINHYFTKSAEEWWRKTRRGRPETNDPALRRTWDEFRIYDQNDVEDLTIQRFAPELRRALEDRASSTTREPASSSGSAS